MADVISGEITVYIPDSVLAECVYVLLWDVFSFDQDMKKFS